MRKLLKTALAVLFLPVPSALAQDLTAHFYPEKQEFVIGEPVIVVLEVENNTSRTVEVEHDCDWLHPEQLQIANAPAKKEVRLTGCAPSGGWAGSCGVGVRITPAGEQFERRFLLDREFDFSRPGVYHVKASRRVKVYGDGFDDPIADLDAQDQFDIVLREPRGRELEDAYQPFIADLGSTDEGTKSAAASALTQNPPRFLEGVILSLAANDETVFQSVDGMERLATPAARAKLVEMSSAKDRGLRERAIAALGRIGNSEDCDAILNIAAENELEQTQAYVAAGRICRSGAVSVLASLLPSADDQLAAAVATGLGNTASRDAIRPLISLLLSPDAFVRREADAALFTLTHHGKPRELNDPTDPKQSYLEWRSWWAMNSQAAPIYTPDECPK
jgi:hypothetical protein